MEVENQNTTLLSCPSSSNSSSTSPSFDVLPSENQANVLPRHTPGTVIPNRIFVGGLDLKVSEIDLRHVFSQHGNVKEVKIVIDRVGMSKRYGFVTFETQEDVLKILNNVNGIFLKEKKLCIGQAVRKHQSPRHSRNLPVASPEPLVSHQMSCGTLYLTTSTGCPYTYHNGVAYFNCPNMNPQAHHCSPAQQLMLVQSQQPVHHQQPAHHHYQNVPSNIQWNFVQVPVPSSEAVYPQQPEYLYQPADGGCFQATAPVVEETTPEFVEATVPHGYPGMTPLLLQHNTVKSLMFPAPPVHLKPKYGHHMHHKDYNYLLESTESPEAAVFHASQPFM